MQVFQVGEQDSVDAPLSWPDDSSLITCLPAISLMTGYGLRALSGPLPRA